LLRERASFVGSDHARAVLFHRELRVADFDTHLILELQLTQFSLAIFELRSDLIGLCAAVTKRYVQLQPDAVIGIVVVDRLAEGIPEAGIARDAIRRRWRQWRAAHGAGGRVAAQTRATVEREQISAW